MSVYEYDEEKYLRMEREQSYAEGLESGKAQGLELGKAQEQFRVIMKMRKEGLNSEQISRLTGISMDEIEQISKEK